MNNTIDIKDRLVRSTFNITYVLLMTTATITFIEALRTEDPRIRHIMNIETVISIIAAYFYGKFIEQIKDAEIDYHKINITRYTDWAITTPFMILGLELVLTYNNNESLSLKDFVIPFILNYIMLSFGYLGEIDMMSRKNAAIGGFIFYALLFYFIYYKFIQNKKNSLNMIIFFIFVIFWGIYGIIYLYDDQIKNITYNILDVFSKCLVGIGFWMLLVKMFK
jgi:bacteriorhodopsin